MRFLPLFFVAFTFALLGFCISGIFGFAMLCVLHIYVILDLYLFLAAPFWCSVFWGTVTWLHTSYFVRPCFVGWTALGYSVFYNVICCSALQCSLQSFHCSLLTFLIFLFYCLRPQFIHIDTCLEYLNYLLNTFNLHVALYLVWVSIWLVKDIWYKMLE